MNESLIECINNSIECINHNIESDAVQEGKIYTIDKLHAHERVQEKLKEISL